MNEEFKNKCCRCGFCCISENCPMPRKFFQILVFYGILMAGGSLLMVFLNPARGIGDGGRLIGLTTHPNILGIVAILGIWGSISLFCLRPSRLTKLLTVGVITLCAICVYGANSATSLVVSVAVVAFTLTLQFFDTSRITRLFGLIAGAGFFVIMFVSMAYVLLPEMFSVDAMLGLVGRNATFTGRPALWEMGMAKISQQPIIGWGFQEYINVRGTQIKHFHSGYIELLVRGGLVALFFVIAFVFQIVFSIRRISDPKLYLFFAIMILAILAHNITEGSFGRGVNALWLIFSFIYFYADRAQRVPVQVSKVVRTSVGITT